MAWARTRCIPALLTALLGLAAVALPASAETLLFQAAQSGKQALDQGEGGGNPFASALIELLGRPALTLGDLPVNLRNLTEAKSQGYQSPDVPLSAATPGWSVAPARPGEKRIALVMIVSDYAKSGGAPSLPGALRDAGRIADALKGAGFETRSLIDADLAGMRAGLARFATESAGADVAALYVTGHGVEVGQRVYVVPGDYPVAERNRVLAQRALPLTEIAATPRAKTVNLVFYGGCRDDPLGE